MLPSSPLPAHCCRVHLVEFPAVPARMQLQRMRLEHERVQTLGALGAGGAAAQEDGATPLQRLAL